MRKESEFSDRELKKIDDIIANIREDTWDDHEALALFEKFIRLAFLINEDEQEQIVKLYCEHIAGVKVPHPWQTQTEWLYKVGFNLNTSADLRLDDGITFWQKVHQAIPEFISENEYDWLTRNDPKGSGGFHLLFNLAHFKHAWMASEVITAIHCGNR